MVEVETTETKAAPKKAPRKPDPMGRIINDVRTAARNLGEFSALPTPEHRVRHHDGRAAAWAKQYGQEGTFDSLLLSNAFEALACYEHEQRHALVQLAAVALTRVELLDGAGK